MFSTTELFIEFPGDGFMAAKAVLNYYVHTFSGCLSLSWQAYELNELTVSILRAEVYKISIADIPTVAICFLYIN